MAQHDKAAAKVQTESTSLNLLEWFWRLSRGKKIPVLALVVALVVNLVPVLVRALKPKPDVHIGAAFYAYERGWTVEGKMMKTFSELRNLSSNCYFWQVPPRPLSKATKLVGVHSWVQTKFRFENMSDERITNLRMSIASPLQTRTYLKIEK